MKEKSLVRKHLIWLLLAAWVYTFTFIFNNYWSKYASFKSVTTSFQKSVSSREARFAQWVKDTSLVKELANGVKNPGIFKKLQKLPFHVFVFKDDYVTEAPLFWSTNEVLPDPYHVSFYPSGSFVKYGSGQYEFLKRKVNLNTGPVVVVGLLQLHVEFFIESGILKNEYRGFPGLGGKMELTSKETNYPIMGENGKPIVYFQPLVKEPIYISNWFSFIIECLASIFLFVYITKISFDLIKKRIVAGVLFFLSILFLLRWLILEHGIPINLNQLPLFSEKSLLNIRGSMELRNFMVNAFFGVWGGTFLTNNTGIILRYLGGFSKVLKWVTISLMCLLVIAGHFLLVFFIRDLYLNSSVAFDISNFFSLNYTTVLSFAIIFLLCINHYIVLRFMVLAFMRLSKSKHWVILSMLCFSGLVILTIIDDRSVVLPFLFSLVWILLFFAAGFTRVIKPARTSSGMIVAWLFIYAISISFLLGMVSDTRLQARTYGLSKSLILQRDKTSEASVKIAAAAVKRIDWASIMDECKNELICRGKKDSIINTNFSGYLDRFKTSIYLFDVNNLGVFNSGAATYESLNTLFTTQAKATDYPGLSMFGESFDQFGYIFKQEIRNKIPNSLAGHLFIVVRYVRPGNQTLAPEVFRQLQDVAIDLPQGYSYAWYKNGALVEQYRNYPFQTTLPEAMLSNQSFYEKETKEDYELWMKAGPDTVLALSVKRNVFISFISMLAYLFGAFLIFYCFVALAVMIRKGNLFSGEVYEKLNLNLQSKIRLTVITILMISFVIVAVVTISFFINQFKTGNIEKLSKTVQTISADLNRSLPADYDKYSPDEQKEILQRELTKVTSGQKIDVNCFDNTGMVIASTQNILFEKGVISPMADPYVWWKLTQGEVHRYVSAESIGNLSFTSIYQPLISKRNGFIIYLQVPFFASQNELHQEISNFLVILINIIAFVFLVSGSLAYWISGSITRSYNVIAEKMNRIRLSEHNERIEWSPKDEIGNLVFQYNKMVDQLEDSAKKMAKTEREMAWREMARQVAHEIKNPLTPMKLSLQFLQKAIHENHSDVTQITERVAGNLVGQIDHLSKIATEFSQFANLGIYKPELFNLQFVMRDVIQMYELQENLAVYWQSLSQPLYVYADLTQINRLFTNLLQNATESGGNNNMTQIEVGEKLVPGAVVISISDDGDGIPEAVKKNIFMPNFTTKSSGTGLGLSICKAIIENAGGSIWFETETGVGTTFYVQLPLAQ